jgi:hypothetical protein
MSSNFNNAKIINVYYNKGDRKPYDVNGKPIAYIGEEFVGANQATEIRFHFGEELDSASAIIVAKRANNDTRLDPLVLVPNSGNPYYKIELNAWYAEYKGKMTIIFKVYNGTVTYDDAENPTQITATTGQIIVSDIFNLEVAYAPNASSLVPPFETEDYDDWFFTLSTKLDKAQSITVKGSLPTSGELADNALDNRYFYVQTEGVGRLYYIDGSSPIEVVWGIGTLALASNGNEDITVGTNAGKMYWDEDRGTIIAGLYDDQEAGIGDSLFFFGKATEAIAKCEVVQFNGNTGGNIRIKKAVFAEISAQPDLLMGVAKHAIALNDFGYVVSFGYVRNLNTTAFTTPILYLSTSVAGALSSTKPTTGFKGSIAAVARPSTDGANGFIIVRPNLVKGIGDLADVTITTATSGQILSFDGSKWVNSTRLTTAETDISNIEDGTTIVGKALGDQNGNTIDTTYLTIASGASTYVPLSSKGVANGVAPLGADNKIPSIHLPGGVDDIKEFANLGAFPAVGEASIIYVALDTNKIYRWSGSAYVEISSSLALGTTSSTAFPGDRGLATETKTNNIVSGVQGLTDTRITNSAVGTSPLIVNSVTGTTEDLLKLQVNGSNFFRVDKDGYPRTDIVYSNTNSLGTGNITFGSTGVVIRSNLTNSNPGATINLQNASSTGDILRLQSAGANVLEITRTGGLNQNGTRLFSQPVDNTNTFFGSESGGTATTDVNNTAFGYRALRLATSAVNNVAVGTESLRDNTVGGNNVAVGRRSGYFNTSGASNTFLGHHSGNNALQLATASNSTALGNSAYTDKSNQMVFGNASVSEFVFNRNTSATALLPLITASSANTHLLERTTTIPNAVQRVSTIRHTTSVDMIDGFGNSIGFEIKDNANVDNTIGSLGAVRSGADNSGRLVFNTNNAGSSTEKMTILPDGKVGIGTASPAHLLSVVSTLNTQGIQIRRNSTTTNDYAMLGFRISTSELADNIAEIRAVRTNRAVGSDTDLRLFTHSNNNLLEALRIRDDGLVGINETSPSAQLQVKSGATTRVPLIVDTLASHTENLQVWNTNGSTRARINVNGLLGLESGIFNLSSSLNAKIDTLTTGTTISRNQATSDPALIVNSVQGTSHIQVWQFGGNAVSQIGRNGVFIGQSRPTQNEQTGNYTLALADEGKVLRVNSSSNRTITIPKNSVVAFPIDTEIAILRYGTGTVSIAPVDGDVTLQSADGERKIRNRYGSVALKKIGTDEWVLVGSLEA